MITHRRHYYILISLFFLTISSCASFYAQQPNVAGQIESWLEQQQYDRALSTITAMTPEHPNYSDLNNSIGSIEQQRANYIAETIASAAQFEPRQDWVGARNKIAEGLSNLPNSPELQSQFEFYNTKRIDRLTKDEASVLIAKARYLIDARPFQESMLYNANNRFFAQQQFNNFLQDARMASRELYSLGQRYWQQELRVQAKEALALSIETAPNELSTDLLATILEAELVQRTDARVNQATNADDQLPELKQSFFELLNYNDYLGAQKILNEMKAMEFNDADELQVTLTEQKELKSERLVASGNQLYNSGYIEEAVTRWQQAQLLTPDNAAIEQQLERANTVLNNIERWRETTPTNELQP